MAEQLTSNVGTLTLGQNTVGTQAFSNTGTVNITAGTAQFGSYTQSVGKTTIALGATLKPTSGTLNLNGGALLSSGTVAGSVVGNGIVTPARAAGPLKITGAFTPGATGSVAIGISGATTVGTDYGQVAVTGKATLRGTLALTTKPGYVPPVGTSIKILTAKSITGTFNAITGDTMPGRRWIVNYTATGVTLTAAAA